MPFSVLPSSALLLPLFRIVWILVAWIDRSNIFQLTWHQRQSHIEMEPDTVFDPEPINELIERLGRERGVFLCDCDRASSFFEVDCIEKRFISIAR